MDALSREVADLFPVEGGEDLGAYLDRASTEPVMGKRAMIVASIEHVARQFQGQRQVAKNAWIAAARATFAPSERRPCEVCGKYEGLTHAHHIVPLAAQFDAGAVSPIHEINWLCPTHHAAQHVFIDDLFAGVTKPIPGLPPEESDALHRLGARMVELVTRLPDWHRLRRRG